MKLLSTCSETAQICDKHQYEEIDRNEGLKMKFHLLLCKCCRDYHNRNEKLTQAIKAAEIKILSPEEKEILRFKVKQEIENSSNTYIHWKNR